jgi:hypothetical protein
MRGERRKHTHALMHALGNGTTQLVSYGEFRAGYTVY